MNLLSVENIAKSYGELVLFADLSFGVNKDQKIALIAKNGDGKTSILNILSGKDVPDAGLVNYRYKEIEIFNTSSRRSTLHSAVQRNQKPRYTLSMLISRQQCFS